MNNVFLTLHWPAFFSSRGIFGRDAPVACDDIRDGLVSGSFENTNAATHYQPLTRGPVGQVPNPPPSFSSASSRRAGFSSAGMAARGHGVSFCKSRQPV